MTDIDAARPSTLRLPARLRPAGAWQVPALIAAAVFLISVFVPMSYDEAYWLAVVKMVRLGRTLYEGALDNKTPGVYGLLGLLDALPGAYLLARAAFMGAGAAVIAGGVRHWPKPARSGWWFASGVAAVAVVLAEFQPATEFVALVLLVASFEATRRGHPLLGGLAVVAALSFDPRAVLLVPGMILVTARDRPVRARLAWTVAAGVAAGVALLLVVPGVRFALVELNAASRLLTPSLAGWVRSLLIPGVAMAPLALAVDFRKASAGSWMLLAAGLLIPPLSLLGHPHYWILVLPALASMPPATPSIRPAVIGAAVVLSLTPGLLNVAKSVRFHSRLNAEADRAASVLAAGLGSDGTYVMFGSLPHLAVRLPAQLDMSGPSSNYMADGTTRTDRYRAELATALQTADAIVEDGSLSAPFDAVFTVHRGTREVFDAAVGDFPCVDPVTDTITIHWRTCP